MDSCRISSLNPNLRGGILRGGGRLRNAPVSENRKHPLIIDHRHPLATLIIHHYHLKMLYFGQQVVIGSTRERFWTPNFRNLVRKILHECVVCFRIKPRRQEQLMAELPSERVNPAPPFLKVVDYCGPFLVSYPQRRSPPVICFVAIFVCLVTKAVHVELVADLTTAAVLAALKRFTARRGWPSLITTTTTAILAKFALLSSPKFSTILICFRIANCQPHRNSSKYPSLIITQLKIKLILLKL